MSVEYTEKQIEGLRKIQRLWRRFIDVQVFRFYRDLIHFHNNGDPQILMRTINPAEAKYIDSAGGIRIRFRLAGERFPPTIYYKIFTNRPIQDLCANAPRDYTRPYMRLKSAAESNNNLNRFPEQDQDGWYRRIENNGWRPVAYTHLLQINMDNYYSSNEYQKSVPFSHLKMQRRQDVELRRKQKKLQWLQKMYKSGMLETNKDEVLKNTGNEKEMSRLINETTTSILKIYNTYGAEAVEDWEVNELLEWTHSLNYDEYLIDWRTIGTSASSNVIYDNPVRHQQIRDIDDRTNSTLTESRHVSVQANVPTIFLNASTANDPEGDEENEGVGQIGEGTRFPHTGVQQPPHPPMHDTLATAAELQPREDEGIGQTPTLQNEIIAVSGDETTGAPEQAEYEQPSSVEKPIIEDGATEGEPPATDAENEIEGQLTEGGTLAGISEDEGATQEPIVEVDGEKPLPSIVETMDDTPQVIPTDEQIRTDELAPDSAFLDEHRRSARSGRDRSGKSQREPPQVEFEDVEQEEQDIVPEEPEVRISREEVIARYQAAEIERDRLKSINLALQQRLADYLHKRKGTDDLPALNQGNERSNAEQQQRYQKYLSEIETLQERIRLDQIDYEKQRNEYEQQIQKKKDHVEQLKSEYVRLVKEIASKAVFSRSGKAISNQEIDNYLALLKEKEDELIKTRHENIRLKNQLKKRESQLKSKEELAEGLHMIDFEQLKIENQTYSEKIEERNEELMKLRKKISTTVQILSHIKEKLDFVSDQREQAASLLGDKEHEVKQKRDELSTIKRRRDRLRQENQSLKQNSGLIGNEQLLRDYEERYDDIEKCTEKLNTLKKRHAEITLMCKVLKKKISKV